jgi:hypothetical protein
MSQQKVSLEGVGTQLPAKLPVDVIPGNPVMCLMIIMQMDQDRCTGFTKG